MKKLTALGLTILTVCALASCEKSNLDNTAKSTLYSTSAEVERNEISAQTTMENEASKETEPFEGKLFRPIQDDNWKREYLSYFSDVSSYYAVYVDDFNGDGFPEVYTGTWLEASVPQSVVTYVKDKGLFTYEFDWGSSMGGDFFFDFDKKIAVLREDSHSLGSMEYHRAEKYVVTDNGFEISAKIEGEKLDYDADVDWEDMDVQMELSEQLRELFDTRFSIFTTGMNLVAYDDVAVKIDIKGYLDDKLKLNEN